MGARQLITGSAGMADPVTDPVAEHDARYGEKGAGPPEPEWARVAPEGVVDTAQVPDEGVAGNHDLRGPISSQAAHRS